MTEAHFVECEMRRFYGSLRAAKNYSASDEATARRDAVNMAQHYIGQPHAFERCTKWLEGAKKVEEERKRQETSTSIEGRRTRVHA